jgi:hypothetical protein
LEDAGPALPEQSEDTRGGKAAVCFSGRGPLRRIPLQRTSRDRCARGQILKARACAHFRGRSPGRLSRRASVIAPAASPAQPASCAARTSCCTAPGSSPPFSKCSASTRAASSTRRQAAADALRMWRLSPSVRRRSVMKVIPLASRRARFLYVVSFESKTRCGGTLPWTFFQKSTKRRPSSFSSPLRLCGAPHKRKRSDEREIGDKRPSFAHRCFDGHACCKPRGSSTATVVSRLLASIQASADPIERWPSLGKLALACSGPGKAGRAQDRGG